MYSRAPVISLPFITPSYDQSMAPYPLLSFYLHRILKKTHTLITTCHTQFHVCGCHVQVSCTCSPLIGFYWFPLSLSLSPYSMIEKKKSMPYIDSLSLLSDKTKVFDETMSMIGYYSKREREREIYTQCDCASVCVCVC